MSYNLKQKTLLKIKHIIENLPVDNSVSFKSGGTTGETFAKLFNMAIITDSSSMVDAMNDYIISNSTETFYDSEFLFVLIKALMQKEGMEDFTFESMESYFKNNIDYITTNLFINMKKNSGVLIHGCNAIAEKIIKNNDETVFMEDLNADLLKLSNKANLSFDNYYTSRKENKAHYCYNRGTKDTLAYAICSPEWLFLYLTQNFNVTTEEFTHKSTDIIKNKIEQKMKAIENDNILSKSEVEVLQKNFMDIIEKYCVKENPKVIIFNNPNTKYNEEELIESLEQYNDEDKIDLVKKFYKNNYFFKRMVEVKITSDNIDNDNIFTIEAPMLKEVVNKESDINTETEDSFVIC